MGIWSEGVPETLRPPPWVLGRKVGPARSSPYARSSEILTVQPQGQEPVLGAGYVQDDTGPPVCPRLPDLAQGGREDAFARLLCRLSALVLKPSSGARRPGSPLTRRGGKVMGRLEAVLSRVGAAGRRPLVSWLAAGS